jgi:dihydroorotase
MLPGIRGRTPRGESTTSYIVVWAALRCKVDREPVAVRWLDPSQGIDQECLVNLGTHPQISQELPAGSTQKVLMPGLVDLYSHSGEPGHEERETLESLMQGARAGGFVEIAILPDTEPVMDDPALVSWIKKQAPSLHILASLTVGNQGKELVDTQELLRAGAIGFAATDALKDLILTRGFLEYLGPNTAPVFLWPQHPSLAKGVAREGVWSMALGLTGVPLQAETIAVSTILDLVELTGTPVHLMRLSCQESVERLRVAKAKGLPVTGSVTVAHLIHTVEELVSFDPNLRVNPPLGTQEDQAALIAGLADGTIDAIATDHSPWTYEEKVVPFAVAPPGMVMLSLALPLLWTHLVETKKLEALDLVRALSTGPRKVLGLPANPSWVLFNPQTTWTVNGQTLHSLSQATPCWGKNIQGCVERTSF